jgi:LPS-assembly lipoprotein
MIKKFFAAVVCLSLLAGCGWHLHGYQPVPYTLHALTLRASDVYTPLYRTFRNEYEKRRINLDAPDAMMQLTLLQENITTHIESLDIALHPAENELSLHISYQISHDKQPPRVYELQLHRTSQQGSKSPAAIDNENNRLIDEMRKEASERILNQLQTLSAQASPSVETTPGKMP